MFFLGVIIVIKCLKLNKYERIGQIMFKEFPSKFKNLVENEQARLENDGFLIGDYVEFKKTFNPDKHPWTARRGERYKETCRAFMTEGLPLRVAEMYTENVPQFTGRSDTLEARSAPRILNIYQENIPAGRIGGEILPVPSEVMNVVDVGANWSPPRNWYKEEETIISPREVVTDNENLRNPSKNVVIPAKSARTAVVKSLKK